MLFFQFIRELGLKISLHAKLVCSMLSSYSYQAFASLFCPGHLHETNPQHQHTSFRLHYLLSCVTCKILVKVKKNHLKTVHTVCSHIICIITVHHEKLQMTHNANVFTRRCISQDMLDDPE